MPRGTGDAYVDFVMFEAEFQVIVDGFVRDFAKQGKVGNANLLLLRCLEHGLPHLGLSPTLSPIAHVGDRLRTTKAAALLLPTNRAS